MSKYTIRLVTPRVPHAGTDAFVYGKIFGERGESAWRVLDNPGDDREQGSVDYYRLGFDIDFGRIDGLRLAIRRWDNNSPDWLLEAAHIVSVDTFDLYHLPFDNWLYPPPDGRWAYYTLRAIRVGKLDPKLASPFIW